MSIIDMNTILGGLSTLGIDQDGIAERLAQYVPSKEEAVLEQFLNNELVISAPALKEPAVMTEDIYRENMRQ